MSTQASQSTNQISDFALDTLLEQHALQPPDDFAARVITAVDQQDKQTVHAIASGNTQKLTWWQWLALLLAAPPGMAQVFALVFSAWHVSSAG